MTAKAVAALTGLAERLGEMVSTLERHPSDQIAVATMAVRIHSLRILAERGLPASCDTHPKDGDAQQGSAREWRGARSADAQPIDPKGPPNAT